jgi:hypothetical protein
MIDEKTRRFAANSIFPSFIFAAFGLVLVQVGLAKMSGSWQLHAIAGLPGLTLSGLALYRSRLHWSADIIPMRAGVERKRLSSRFRDLAWYLLLFGTGVAAGLAARSAFLFGIAASLMYLVQWTKISVCRTRFIVSAIITLAGAFAWLALYGKPIYGLYYVVAAWMVLIPSMFMTLLVLVSLPHGYRVGESGQVESPVLDTHQPVPE